MATPEKVKLLLVCPEASSLRSAAAALEQQGYAVEPCPSLYRAVLAQRSDPRPLVLLDARDVKTEDQDFFAILREILPSVFILAILPESRRETAAALLQVGADAYLVEPFFPAELSAILRKAVERSRQYLRRDEQLADRLGGLARFASGVAHEINNPLCVISGWLQVLLSDAPADSPNRKTFGALHRETERIATVVRDLLALSGQAAPNRTLLDLNQLLDGVLCSAEKSNNNGQMQATRQFAPDLPPVLANEAQLKEACQHLVRRGRDAAGPGGRLSVQTASLHGDQVEVRVHDSGPALSGEARERLFDPFFLTEEGAPIEGLGLCVSYGIVRGLGGTLSVSSSEGDGTTLVMCLPAASVVGRTNGVLDRANGKRNGNAR